MRSFEADIYLIRELILGSQMDGQGEYDLNYHGMFKSESNLNILYAGANIGMFTLLASATFPDAHIVAVEPDEEN